MSRSAVYANAECYAGCPSCLRIKARSRCLCLLRQQWHLLRSSLLCCHVLWLTSCGQSHACAVKGSTRVRMEARQACERDTIIGVSLRLTAIHTLVLCDCVYIYIESGIFVTTCKHASRDRAVQQSLTVSIINLMRRLMRHERSFTAPARFTTVDRWDFMA